MHSIQYLRGVAALLVVFYHVIVQLHRLGSAALTPDVLGSGVDIFFVISGFVIWYTTSEKNLGLAEFLRHRIIRIVPLYWLVTSFYFWVLLLKPGWMQSAKFGLYNIVASYFFVPAPSPAFPKMMWPLVIQGWTLNYEMFFYLVFGFVLFLAVKTRVKAVIAILICIVSLQALNPSANSLLGFYTSSIILEFAFGVFIGYLYTSGVSVFRLLSLLVFFSGLFIFVIEFAFGVPHLPEVLGSGIPAMLVVAGSVFYERANRVVRLGLPEFLGDASYSIYLSHGAVLSAFAQLWSEWHMPPTSEPVYFFIFIISAVTMAILFGAGLHQFVERPLLRSLSNRFKTRVYKARHLVNEETRASERP